MPSLYRTVLDASHSAGNVQLRVIEIDVVSRNGAETYLTITLNEADTTVLFERAGYDHQLFCLSSIRNLDPRGELQLYVEFALPAAVSIESQLESKLIEFKSSEDRAFFLDHLTHIFSEVVCVVFSRAILASDLA